MNQRKKNMALKDILPNSNIMHDVAGNDAVTSIATRWGMGGGTATSIFGWLTSNSSAVLIGILVTVGGFIVNYWFQVRRERREVQYMLFQQELAKAEEKRKEELHTLQLQALRDNCKI